MCVYSPLCDCGPSFSPVLEWIIWKGFQLWFEIFRKEKLRAKMSHLVVLCWEACCVLSTSAEACWWSQLSTLGEVNLGRTFKSPLTFNLYFWVGFSSVRGWIGVFIMTQGHYWFIKMYVNQLRSRKGIGESHFESQMKGLLLWRDTGNYHQHLHF